jgi:hypothetical protein
MSKLLSNVTTDSVGDWQSIPPGIHTLWAGGTFGGGSVSFDWSPDDGTIAIPLTDENGVVSLSSNDSREVSLPACKLRASLAGSTGPSLSAGAAPVYG